MAGVALLCCVAYLVVSSRFFACFYISYTLDQIVERLVEVNDGIFLLVLNCYKTVDKLRHLAHGHVLVSSSWACLLVRFFPYSRVMHAAQTSGTTNTCLTLPALVQRLV
jgi:hypothetical protein